MFNTLLFLKLTLAPTFVLAGTLAGRRWGGRVGGFVAGFPNTAGPVLFLITLEQGVSFGAATAGSSLLGLVALAAFIGQYPHSARRFPWWACLGLGWVAYFAVMLVLQHAHWPWYLNGLAALCALNAARYLMPHLPAPDHAPQAKWFDLYLRSFAAIGMVLLLTGLAHVMGPNWSGLLTPFPVTSAVLAVFAQQDGGAAASEQMLKGILIALNAVAVMMLVIAFALPLYGIAAAFALGVLIGGFVQVAQFYWHR
jgi:hypothetical protein